jgi:hypothetical protein
MQRAAMKRIIGSVLLTMLLACCASAPQQTQPLLTDQTFNAPKNTVWPLLMAEIGLNYPIRSADMQNGLLTTDDASLPVGNWNINKAIRRWVLSPGGNILIGHSGLRVALNVHVTGLETGKTHVVIRAHYEALEGPVGASDASWVAVRSNGSLEHEILTRIADQLPKTQ